MRLHLLRRPAPDEEHVDGEVLAEQLPIGLIVGLGNPGKEYAGNRHNVGFWCLNRLARQLSIDFETKSKLASVGEGVLNGRLLVLAKPRTYVNASGPAVRELLRRYRLQPSQLLVVYDELDLPLGAVRLRERGSAGGQNGMKSIIAAIGSQDFPRVRIGIGRPLDNGEPTRDPEIVARYVLADPPPGERRQLDSAIDEAIGMVASLLARPS